MKIIVACILAGLLVLMSWGPASSEPGGKKGSWAFGPRAGYGVQPDQFVAGIQGVHYQAFKFMHFAPSVDLGFGDKVTTYLFNADLRMLSFSPPGSQAGLYAGAGPAIAVLDPKKGDRDTEVGINAVSGLTLPLGRRHQYVLEVRLGFGDIPDFRILLGVMFGGR